MSRQARFLDEATKNWLAQSKRRVLITGGFATEAVVLRAVLDARAEGYEILVPVDACGGAAGHVAHNRRPADYGCFVEPLTVLTGAYPWDLGRSGNDL